MPGLNGPVNDRSEILKLPKKYNCTSEKLNELWGSPEIDNDNYLILVGQHNSYYRVFLLISSELKSTQHHNDF